jgi:hypothetical protein
MANEIAISQTVSNTTLGTNKSTSYRGDWTLKRRQVLVKNVGLAEETFSPDSDLTTVGFCWLTNKDATNYVDWGFSTGVYGGRLRVGDPPTCIFIATTSIDIFLLANTAACDVEIEVWAA